MARRVNLAATVPGWTRFAVAEQLLQQMAERGALLLLLAAARPRRCPFVCHCRNLRNRSSRSASLTGHPTWPCGSGGVVTPAGLSTVKAGTPADRAGEPSIETGASSAALAGASALACAIATPHSRSPPRPRRRFQRHRSPRRRSRTRRRRRSRACHRRTPLRPISRHHRHRRGPPMPIRRQPNQSPQQIRQSRPPRLKTPRRKALPRPLRKLRSGSTKTKSIL
jgi:hypothetical protein